MNPVSKRTEELTKLAQENPGQFRGLIRSYQVTYGALFHRAGQPYPFESLIADILQVEIRAGKLFSKEATCIKCGKVFGTNLDSKLCSKCAERERFRDLVHLEVRYGRQGKSARACWGVRKPLEGKRTSILGNVTCQDCHGVVLSEIAHFNIISIQNKKRLTKEKLAYARAQVRELVPRDVRRMQLEQMPESEVIAAGRKAVELMGFEVSADWVPESIQYIVACEAKNKTIADHDFDCYGCGKASNHGTTKPNKLPLCFKCLPLFFNAECTQEFWPVALDICLEKGVFDEVRKVRETQLKEAEKEKADDARLEAPR